MYYFLIIILKVDRSYTYRLCKGNSIYDCRKLFDISKVGARKWMEHRNKKLLYKKITGSFFEGRVFANRAYSFL